MLLIYTVLLIGKKIKELFLVFVFIAYTNIYLFLLLTFAFIGVLNLYSIGYFIFIFSYITIIVNLYDITHGKNNQLYNYFCFWFLCLQHIPVFIYFFFFFWFLCLLVDVFNLYSTSFFFFLYDHCCKSV